jgi:hypothetical protein
MYQQLNQGTIAAAIEAGQITADEGAQWWAGLEQAAMTETFFSVNLGFIVAGGRTWVVTTARQGSPAPLGESPSSPAESTAVYAARR